eukprot:775091-Rhodomonas_salina.2
MMRIPQEEGEEELRVEQAGLEWREREGGRRKQHRYDTRRSQALSSHGTTGQSSLTLSGTARGIACESPGYSVGVGAGERGCEATG